jgi:CBS domain containing-hemolysin-like protein
MTTGATTLWVEAGLAATLLLVAGFARAAAARHHARANRAGAAPGQDPRAELVTAELAWAALLAPALLLAAHALPRLFPGTGSAGALVTLTFAALVLGDALPSRLGDRFRHRAPRAGRLLGILALPLRPFASHLVRRRDARPQVEPAAADEEKLLQRLLEAKAGGEADQDGETELVRHLLGRVLHLRETHVGSIMRPRSEIVWIGHRERPAAAARLMRESGHSRILVCGRELDDVIGVLQLKDVFLALHRVPPEASLGAIGREPVFVDDGMPLTNLLRRWGLQGGTIAIVREGSGRVVGLITLSDVLEWLLPARTAAPATSAGAG